MTNATNGTTDAGAAAKKNGSQRLDAATLVSGSLVPCGIATGNIAFEFLVALTGALWIARSIVARKNPFPQAIKHPLIVPWIFWVAAIMASLVINGPGNKGWMHDIALVRYLFFVMAVIDLSRRRPVVKYLIYGLGAGALWGALNTLFAYLLGFDFLGRDVGRYALKLKEASRISAFSAYASTFFLSWWLFDKKINRNKKIIIAGIAFVALSLLLQTHIRTSILAAGSGMIFMVGYMGQKRSGFPVAILNVFLACAVTLFFLFAGTFFFTAASPDAQMDMHRLSSYEPNFNSLHARFEIWKVASAMWLENPIFGVGISSFQDAYREVASIVFSGPNGPSLMPGDIMEQTHAHNLLLMLASGTGILGVAAFAWLFTNAARFIFKNGDGYRVGLTAWPVVIFVMGLTGFNIYHSWYQALLAYLIVLIGCHGKGREEQIVW